MPFLWMETKYVYIKIYHTDYGDFQSLSSCIQQLVPVKSMAILSVHGQFEEQTQATHCGNAWAAGFHKAVFDGCFD